MSFGIARSFARGSRVAALFAAASVSALAQGHGGPGGGAGMGGPGIGGRPPGGFGGLSAPRPAISGGNLNRMRGSLQLGPPGRWWDDRKFAHSLGLRADQQKKMDTVFNANKGVILERYQTLLDEEAKMESLTRESHLQEAAIFAQVDRVSQARASLQKATAHLSLLLRQEMDPDQISKLEDQH